MRDAAQQGDSNEWASTVESALATLPAWRLVAALMLAGAPTGPTGDVDPNLPRLTSRTPRTRPIAGSDNHHYRVFLHQKDAVRVRVTGRGLGLVLTAIAPDGDTIASVNTGRLILIGHATGDYQVVVCLEWPGAPGGRYRIALEGPAESTTSDRLALDAQSLLSTALPLRSNAPQRVLRLAGAAARLAQEARDPALTASALYLLGEARGHLGDFPGALRAWTSVLPIATRLGDAEMLGSTLATRGRLYLRLGQLERAEADLAKAAAILARSGALYAAAIAGGNRAELAVQRGQMPEALRLYEALLVMTRRTGDRLREGVVLNDLAIAYQRAGHFQRARQLFGASLPLLQAVGDPRNLAIALHNIGALHLAMGDARSAIRYFDESLRRREGLDPYGMAVTLGQLGSAYAAAGDTRAARAALERAVSLRSEADVAGRAYTFTRLGAVLAETGELDRALDTFADALRLHRQARQRLGEADALYGMSRVLVRQGRLTEARERIEECLAIVERLRWDVGSRNLRAYFLGSVHDYYATEIDVLMALHRRSPRDGFDVLAFEASERARARTLLELLTADRARPTPRAASSLLRRRRELAELLAIKGEQQVRLATRPHSPAVDTSLSREVEELSRQYEQIEAMIEKRASAPAQDAVRRRLTLGDVQRHLDGRSVLLEYALGDDRSYLWVVARRGITSYELPGRGALETLAFRLRTEWGRSGAESSRPRAHATPDTRSEVERLSTMLLPPLQDLHAGARLLIVPDAALNLVPFGALIVHGTPLISTYEVEELPSAGALAALRSTRSTRTPAARVLALVADPVYEPDDPRVRGSRPHVRGAGNAARPMPAVESPWAPPFVRLPFARLEARAILSMASATRPLTLWDFRANRTDVLLLPWSDFRIVHFATHAVVNRENPDLSGIVLSQMDSTGRARAGLVSLLDIARLKVRADLIVLSACETASGDVVPGEGVMSIARAFLHAGATAVVASLWEVDDAATAELMRRFYAGVLGPQHLHPSTALRRAQLSVSASARWRDPHFWAGFVLLGE